MSAEIISEGGRSFKSYAAHIEQLLTGRCDAAVVAQVVAVVDGLEQALRRQAQDEIDIELRLTTLEETVLRRLDDIASALEDLTC